MRRAFGAGGRYAVGLAVYGMATAATGAQTAEPRAMVSESCKPLQGGETRFVDCPENLRARVNAMRLPSPAKIEPCPEDKDAVCFSGVIVRGKVTEALRAALEGRPPFTRVILNSTGGSPGEAILAGRMLHDRKARTFIRADGVCLSACNFIFLGGIVRETAPGAVFASHSFDLACMERENQKDIAALAAEEATYAMDMGVSKCFVPDVMLKYSVSSMRCVEAEALVNYNVVNGGPEAERGAGPLPPCERQTQDVMNQIYQAARQNANRSAAP